MSFGLGKRVTKKSGSRWTGLIVGSYSTALTPVGWCVESETETGSVQIYPEKALVLAPLAHTGNLDGGVPNHFDHTKRGFDPK